MNAHDEKLEKRTARLFRNGRSQAVRIPKEFEFEGDEVFIEKGEDGTLVLAPARRRPGLLAVLATLEPLPEEDWLAEIEDMPPEPIDLGLDGKR